AHDWKPLVREHARRTGAPELAQHAIDEIAAHLEDVYLDRRRNGTDDAAARRAAMDVLNEAPLATLRRSRTRLPEARPHVGPGGRGWVGIGGDFTFAWRQLRRSPSFAAIAIATLGLGAGAATAIFSVVDAVLLKPLPYRQPDQLVAIWETNAEKALPKERLSPVNFMDYRATQPVFTDAAAWWRPEMSLYRAGEERQRVSAIEVSGNVFQLLGVSPQLGAGFPQNGPFYTRDTIVVISDRLWRQRYGADPHIVGRFLDVTSVSIAGAHYVIAGVMPPGFNF